MAFKRALRIFAGNAVFSKKRGQITRNLRGADSRCRAAIRALSQVTVQVQQQ
jgi:hypothetical protein